MKHLFILLTLLAGISAWGQSVELSSDQVKVRLDASGFFSSIKVKHGNEMEEVLTEPRYYPLLTAHTYQAVYPASLVRHNDTLVCLMDDGGQVLLRISEATDIALEVIQCPRNYKFLSFGPLGLTRNQLVVVPINIKTHHGLPQPMIAEARQRYGITDTDTILSRTPSLIHGNRILQLHHAANRLGTNGSAYAGPVRDCRMAWIDPVAGRDGAIEGAGIRLQRESSSPIPPTPKCMVTSVTAKSLPDNIRQCQALGNTMLIISDAFKSFGHYEFKDDLAADDRAMKELVDLAAKKGIVLGVRIPSNHISPNDAYVTPKPSAHLLRQLQFVLLQPADSGATTLQVLTGRGSCFTTHMPSANMIKLGNEMISYRHIEEYDEVIFLDSCTRGALGTKASAHNANDLGARYWMCPDGAFMADCQLQDSLADRIIQLVNHTGMKVLLIENLDHFEYTGHSDYDASRFLERLKGGFDHPVQLFQYVDVNEGNAHTHKSVFPLGERLEHLQLPSPTQQK